MTRLIKRAIKDLIDNRFLSAATIMTIALAALTIGTFGLLFSNAEILLNSWKRGIRLMVYLKSETSEKARLSTQYQLTSLAGVKNLRFIPKEEALERLANQLNRQTSLLQGLNQNPLPDAFEVTLVPKEFHQQSVDIIAKQIETFPTVASVEYGQEWLQRFAGLFDLFKLGGYVLGAVLTLAAILIIANTIRIGLYARKEEIDIMRLVGATDGFIKGPIYLQGIIQGGLGSLLGIAALYGGFVSLGSHFQSGLTLGLFSIQFLSLNFLGSIALAGMTVGWLGSIISLKQFLST